MTLLKYFTWLFNGGNDAKRTKERVSRGDKRERGIVHSFASIRERAISDFRDIQMLAEACADERGRDTGQMPQDPICRESRALIAAARRTGFLVMASSVPGSRYTICTGESEVRLVQSKQVYYKIKNPFAKAHLKKHPVEFALLEHIVHNMLFPDCKLDFVGIAECINEARIVYRQDAVRSDMRPGDGQIAKHLSEIGLRQEGRYAFGNEYLFVTDVGQDGDNVLLDDYGALRFIDPVLGFKESPQHLLKSALANESMIDNLLFGIYCIAESEQRTIGYNSQHCRKEDGWE